MAEEARYFALRKAAAWFVPDRFYARLAFLKHHGRFPRNPPVSFTEKVCERIASGEMSRFQSYCDKLSVRDYVARTAGPQYLVPQFANAKSLTRELWDSLPDTFILKPNHGSGWTRIVRNKSAERFEAVAAEAERWLKKNFYYIRRERQYRDIEPRLIFEQILTPNQGNSLEDYKIFCFHGKARLIQVTIRQPSVRRLLYDLNWNKLQVRYTYANDGEHPRPTRLAEMQGIADALSTGIDYVRVDLYNAREGIFFGEMTFAPAAASDTFDPPAFDEFLGKLWDRPDASADMTQWLRPTATAGQ